MITDEQVIKALDAYYGIEHVGGARESLMEGMRKALEAYEQSKPKPEPVGYAWIVDGQIRMVAETKLNSGFKALYTTPPTREPLSEDEISKILFLCRKGKMFPYSFARDIERAHGIGVTK